jgi:1,4-alpha-glucan branching enzyme
MSDLVIPAPPTAPSPTVARAARVNSVGPSPHAGMGAVLVEKGCSFRVWAPNADAVSVAGTFTGWEKAPIPMARDGQSGAGHDYWSVFVPGVA